MTSPRNQLPFSLPAADWAELEPLPEHLPVRPRQVLKEPCSNIAYIHFIEHGLAALQARTHSDGAHGFGKLCRFGMSDLLLVLGTICSSPLPSARRCDAASEPHAPRSSSGLAGYPAFPVERLSQPYPKPAGQAIPDRAISCRLMSGFSRQSCRYSRLVSEQPTPIICIAWRSRLHQFQKSLSVSP